MATLAASTGTQDSAPLRRAALCCGGAVLLLVVFSAVLPRGNLPTRYFWSQDLPVAVLLIALLAWAGIGRLPRVPAIAVTLTRRRVLLGAALLALLLWAGTYLLMFDYPLTRDEHMVVFDAAIYAKGRLAAPLPPEWRDYATALTPAFLLDLPGRAAWVSSYMPGNALLRTGFSMLLDPALMNPMLAAIGAVALFDIATRLFPDRRDAQAVVLLLYLTSTQMIVTAMTTYAMTAHLALNLVWLALFLRGRRWSHAAAIAVGFLATGLHQVIFHPLFVLPFLDQARREKRWTLLLVYCAAYAAIGFFWVYYPGLVADAAGLRSDAAPGAGSFFSERVLPLILNRDMEMLPLMGLNLVRFASWQNLALLPLVLLAVPVARRTEGIAQPLYIGVLLTLVAMAFLLPYQGHGWGYRYLHGLIGSLALLAGYGWRELGDDRVCGRSFLIVGTAVTICLSLPLLLMKSYAFVKPYADVNAMIQATDTDFVVVDTEPVAFAIDEVRNNPDLGNRPIRLSSQVLSPALLEAICARGTITFVSREQMHRLGLGIEHPPSGARFRLLRASVAGRDCGVRAIRR